MYKYLKNPRETYIFERFSPIDRFYSTFTSCPEEGKNHLEQSSRELNHSRTNVSPLSLSLSVRWTTCRTKTRVLHRDENSGGDGKKKRERRGRYTVRWIFRKQEHERIPVRISLNLPLARRRHVERRERCSHTWLGGLIDNPKWAWVKWGEKGEGKRERERDFLD